MKGLLLKEFYSWLRTRSWVLIYVFIICFLSSVSSLSVHGIALLVAFISSEFLYDEKSNWAVYSKVLPCTPFQRVTAKYIVHSAEFLVAVTVYLFSMIISAKNREHSSFFYTPPSTVEIYAKFAAYVAFSSVFLAVSLFVAFRFKGTLRIVLEIFALIPLVGIFFIGTNLISLMSEERWLPAVTAAVGILILCVSWMMSVAFETNSDVSYKKKFKKAGIILAVIAVAAAGVSVGVVFSNGSAVNLLSDDKNGEYEYISDIKSIEEEYNDLYEFCEEFHIGQGLEECAAEFDAMGYYQNIINPERLFSDSGKINVNLTTDEKTGKITSVFVYCNLAEKIIADATADDFKKIRAEFAVGMTQDELHSKFNALTIFPNEISEHNLNGTQPQRSYTLRFSSNSYNGNYMESAVYKIYIETDGETVIEVNDMIFEHSDDSEQPDAIYSTDEPEETPLEIATREMTDFISVFCNETHIEETPGECAQKLKDSGYLESEETDNLYYSEDGKISVMLVANTNDELEKITAIANYGEIRYIESATEQEMNELSEKFVLGMTEKTLQERFVEADAIPEIIEEYYTDKKQIQRSYKLKYLIGDYNGNGSATYSLTVEVTDGKVDYAAASVD